MVAKRLAQEHDVLCLPGSMFGPEQEDYLRFAFANVEKKIGGIGGEIEGECGLGTGMWDRT